MNELILNTNNISNKEIEVCVKGYIDTDTSEDFGKYITKIHEENSDKKLFINFSKVTMITSSCIRWLMSFHKKGYNYELTNVSKEVFTVLKLTGLSGMLNIKQETFSINTEGCKLLGKGFHSEVYRIDDETIAKVYYDMNDIDDVIRERMIAKQAFVKGVPTEISFGMCEADGKPGLVYELVDAKTLLSVLVEDQNNIDKYVKEYVELVKETHNYNNSNMDGIYDKKQDFIDQVEFNKPYISNKCYEVLSKLKDDIPENDQLLHGDPHPANVMLTEKGMIFIDLSDMGFGDEKFDLMFLYRTLILFGMLPGKSAYALNKEGCIRLWNCFIKEYYKGKDQAYVDEQLRIIKLLGLNSIIYRFCLKDPESENAKFMINELEKTIG